MKSIYKGVYFKKANRHFKPYYIAKYALENRRIWTKHVETEREAAIAYDKKMIELGKEPVNILKKKD